MLRSLGAPSVALAFAGGKAGELLEEGLTALGIDTAFVAVEGETRTNVSIVPEKHDRYLKVNEPGPTVDADARRAFMERVEALAEPGDWWVLAGSLPPGVPADYYAEIITVIGESGGHTLLDTSGEALRAGCAAYPDLVKPNDIELAQLTGMPVETEEELVAAAHALQRLGPGQVVVSLGKKGALAVAGEEVYRVTAPRIEEKNPIGAGDSLVGGLVWALDRGDALPEALRWGVACGAATAASSGTALGSREHVERLRPEAEVHTWASAR
jgi:1-phosphofructokinase family hexose kinase